MQCVLNDKVVIVTGAAGVIGRHFVRCIAANGGIAVATDIGGEAVRLLAREVEEAQPGRVFPMTLDIRSKDSIAAVIHAVRGKFGRIDAVVNNAYPRNANYGRRIEEVAYEDFCENTNAHLGGYFLVMQQFALLFKEAGGGNIVNMSSVYGVMAPRFDIYAGTPMTMPVEYAAIKSAVIHLTHYFAEYFKRDSVRINCISPGGILAGQPENFLMRYKAHCGTKGMLDPQDVSGCLLFLLSDASKYINGQNLIVDDGFSL